MERYLFIAATLALTVYGQVMIRSRAMAKAPLAAGGGKLQYLSLMFTDPLVLSALAGAVLASVFWVLALERTSVSVAYPFMALSFVLVPLAASLLLAESISVARLIGLILIVAGVAIHAVAR